MSQGHSWTEEDGAWLTANPGRNFYIRRIKDWGEVDEFQKMAKEKGWKWHHPSFAPIYAIVMRLAPSQYLRRMFWSEEDRTHYDDQQCCELWVELELRDQMMTDDDRRKAIDYHKPKDLH